MLKKLNFLKEGRQESRSFLRLMTRVRPYKMRIVLALLATIVVAGVESYLAAFISPLVNMAFLPAEPPSFIGGDSSNILQTLLQFKDKLNYFVWGSEYKVWAVPVFFLILVVIRGGARYVSAYFLSWVSANVLYSVRSDMFKKMLYLPSEYQQKTPSSFMTSQMMNESGVAINGASEAFIVLTRDTLIVIGLVCVLIYLNWQLSLVVLMIFPALSWLARYYRHRLKDVQKQSQKNINVMTNVINETHNGHRIVKIFGGYENAIKRFKNANDVSVWTSKKLAQATSARSPFSELIASIALAIVIFIALWQSQASQTTIGDFMAFIVAMLQMVSPIKNLSNLGIKMQRVFIASDAVRQFLDMPNEDDQGKKELKRAQGHLRFHSVSARYGIESKDALSQFSLNIQPGEKVALVGRSGSGKTTLVNLLPRFVPLYSGGIFLDGVNIEQIKLDDLRAQFAFVSQEVFLFDDTLKNNVLYGCPNATDVEVMQALKAANMWSVVQKSPDGWDMQIGQNGNQLSGGQRQRVSIARAILKNAPILILDEATSALDNESERLVQQAIDRLMEHRTSIIVAHRLSTIEQVDRIVVIDEGKIVVQVTHRGLMELKGRYFNLQKHQI